MPSLTQLKTGPSSLERQMLFSSPEKRRLVLSLLLVVITLLLYQQTSHFSFLNFDDDIYVTENSHVRQGLSWSTIEWAITSIDADWHPITWLSHALDCEIFHLNPAGPHLVNVLFHALNSVLLFSLLARGTKRVGLSFLVAVLFVVHPLNVESVAWVSERKNVLSTTFFFLTVGAYGWYALKPGWKRYLILAWLLACGLAAKSMLVTLPFVLLLLDYWPLARFRGLSGESIFHLSQAPAWRLVLEKVPLFVLAAADSVMTVIAQRHSGAVGSFVRLPFGVRLENAINSYAEYIWKAFWPLHLANMYPHPGSLPASKVALAAGLLVASSFLVVRHRSRHYLSVGWLFFLGTLVPVIGLVQLGSQAMADRYAYIPLLGILIMVVWGLADVAKWKRLDWRWCTGVAATAVLVLAAIAFRQTSYWKDSFTLWSHAIAVTGANFAAEDGLAGALIQADRPDDAYEHLQRAASISPYDPLSRADMGAYLHQHGKLAEAIAQYEAALRLSSEHHLSARVNANLGSAYAQAGNFTKSHESFDHALQLDAGLFNVWQGMGDLAVQEGNIDEAIRDFSRAVELTPTAEGYMHLGRALDSANRPVDARRAYRAALKLSPNSIEAQRAVASLSIP